MDYIKKTMNRKLYIYSDNSRYEYRIKNGDLPYLKIGETEQENVDVRIDQQDTTSTSEPLDKKYEMEISQDIHDTDIHDFLEMKGYSRTRLDKKREWFEISLNDAIKCINEYVYGSHRIDNYLMRDEQAKAHKQMVEYFHAHADEDKVEFLLSAKMRFGKNFTLLNTMRTLQCKNVLVLTYKPWVFDSLEGDVNNHVLFENFNYINFYNDRRLSQVDDKKTNIIVASAQLSMYEDDQYSGSDESVQEHIEEDNAKTFYSSLKRNLRILKEYDYDMVVVDEYHYGASTEKFKELLSELAFKRIVYVSGTAMRDIQSHRFENEQVFNWTYIDEQNKADNDMPQMKLFAISLDQTIIDEAHKYFEVEEYPKMEKLFEVDENASFVHRNMVEMMLEQIMGASAQHRKASPFLIDNINKPKHIFCIMPSNVREIEALCTLIKELYGDRFYVILASGSNGIKTEKELLKHIAKAKQENKSSITLSCVRFREGVTVPDWDSVLMLDDGESVVSYFQAIFRCQSQYRKDSGMHKKECYVFDYNPQRMLMLTYLMTEVQSLVSDDDHKEVIRKFFDCAPMVSYNAQNEFETIDFDKLNEAFFLNDKSVDKGVRSFDKERNFNSDALSHIDTAYIPLLPLIKKGKPKQKEEDVTNNGVGGGKVSHGNPHVQKTGNEADTSQLEKLKESLLYITSRLPEYMFNTIENEFSLNDILETTTDNSYTFFSELCQTDLDVFKSLIKDHILDERLMNRLIVNYKHEGDDFWKERTPDKYSYISRKYFIDDDDVKTPIRLAKLMIDKLDSSVWTNPDYTFCDLACKDPSFLLVIKYKLMEGLKDIIVDKKERSQYIVEHMLYGYCRTQSQRNIACRVLDAPFDTPHIICCNDILEFIKNNDMPKFDIVVMNPPYKDRMHLKFLDTGIKLSKKILLSIQPCNWLIKQGGTNFRGGNTERRVIGAIEKFGADIDLVNGAQFFDAGLLAELSINLIDKNRSENERKIKVFGDLSNSITEYSHVSDISKFGDDKLITSMRNKIISYIDKNHSIYDYLKATPRMLNHCSNNALVENHPDKKWYCVNMSAIRGHVNQTTGEKETAFYTLIPKDRKPEHYNDKLALYVKFDNFDDTKKFIDYLKTDFVRFALFLTKTDANIVNCLKFIPYVNDKKSLSDSVLFDMFCFTDSEIKRIFELIPDYYGIRK